MNIIKGIFKFIGIYLILVITIVLIYIDNLHDGLNISIITICLLSLTLSIVINHVDVFKSKLFYYNVVIFHILSLFTTIVIIFVFTYIVKKHDMHITHNTLDQNTSKVVKYMSLDSYPVTQ